MVLTAGLAHPWRYLQWSLQAADWQAVPPSASCSSSVVLFPFPGLEKEEVWRGAVRWRVGGEDAGTSPVKGTAFCVLPQGTEGLGPALCIMTLSNCLE